MKFNFKNKKVLITGSSKGIGYTIAKKFIELSATVTINSHNALNLSKAKNKINNSKLFSVKSDLTTDNNIKQMIKKSIDKMKGLDFLICNLGNGVSNKDIGSENYEDWMNSLKINLLSAIGTINHSKKYLKKSNSASIICISSIAGLHSVKAPLNYATSKAALISYVKSQSKILASDKIRINCISPGNIYFAGGSWEQKLSKNKKSINNYIKNNVPLKRFGTPEEIANACIFLCSDYSSFTTGTNLIIVC